MNLKIEIFVVFLLFLVTVYLSTIKPVLAHVLQSSGSIGAIMHMDPDDEPVAGVPTGFYFEFKDTKGKFDPKNCDCVFSVYQNSNQIYAQPLYQDIPEPSLTNATVFYSFPERNVYSIQVTGKPLTYDGFDEFRLTYDVRVENEVISLPAQVSVNDSEASLINSLTKYLMPILLGILILAFFATILFKKRQKTTAPVSTPEQSTPPSTNPPAAPKA